MPGPSGGLSVGPQPARVQHLAVALKPETGPSFERWPIAALRAQGMLEKTALCSPAYAVVFT